MGMLRVNAPGLVLPGGVMCAGEELLTLEQLGKYAAQFERGEIGEDKLAWAMENACPSCGACSFIGTACTMQIMAEALGLALPGSALLPAAGDDIIEYARRAGAQAVALAEKGLRPKDILTMGSFENAILVHAAVSGSTNCLLHLPAIAHEAGLRLDADAFDRLHRGARYLADLRPTGRWPAEFLHYAGGVPALMEELRPCLRLNEMTVTGRTLGENGSVAVLRGSLAPLGAVIKHTACPREMFSAVLRARPFDSEEEAIDAVLHHRVRPGDAVIIRYEGPRAAGMPEMFYTTEAISSDRELGKSIALITDGRFSGASTGPAIGHCSPEAFSGGPIALVEEGDLILLDVENRVLDIVGVRGEKKTPPEIEAILLERKKRWKPRERKYKRGVLRLFSEHAAPPMEGAYLDYDE